MIPKIDDIVLWDRGDTMFPVYYKGTLRWRTNEGLPGDVQARPIFLGKGEYTVTYGKADIVWHRPLVLLDEEDFDGPPETTEGEI